ncbi:MAG: hypothetical protein RIS36_266 [Pseudomonadota bacterium]
MALQFLQADKYNGPLSNGKEVRQRPMSPNRHNPHLPKLPTVVNANLAPTHGILDSETEVSQDQTELLAHRRTRDDPIEHSMLKQEL